MTKVALVADIHGNASALTAVLADLEAEQPDHVICLGDVAVAGPQPGEVLAMLSALEWPVVLGNTDAWVLNPQPWAIADDDAETGRLMEVELWGAAQLTSPSDQEIIRSFVPTLRLDLGHGIDLLCCHGSPRSFNDAILPDTPADKLDEFLDGESAAIIACGHTHQQMVRRHNEMLLLNPGSVGLPYEMRAGKAVNPWRAEYALITVGERRFEAVLRLVAVNKSAVTRVVYESGMPHKTWWLRDWV